MPSVFDAISLTLLLGTHNDHRYFYDSGYTYKKSVLEGGSQGDLLTAGLDYLLFSKVKEALGGCVTFVGSGAAPLPRHVEEFLRVTLTVPLMQGPHSTVTG